ADDRSQRRRLSGTICAEHRNALTGLDGEIETIEHAATSVALAQTGQRQHGPLPDSHRRGRLTSGRSSTAVASTRPRSRAASSRPAAAGLWRNNRTATLAPSIRSNAPSTGYGDSPTPSPSKSNPR